MPRKICCSGSLQANGITLTFIEKSGLLSTAENLGLLSAVSDRCTHSPPNHCSSMPDGARTCMHSEQSPKCQTRGQSCRYIRWSCLKTASASLRRGTPGKLFGLAFALYALGPEAVYLLSDDSTPLIAAQVLIVAVGALGGTAAFAGGSLLAALQKEF